jgi:branched-chain amino acid transport system ATP-binding protein
MTESTAPTASETAVETLLDVTRVRAGYGGTTVLQDVSIEVPHGGVVALLGPNGVGKTTLLRVVSGLVRSTRGTVTFAGRRIDGLPAHRVARLGLTQVPEGRGIFPGLTVRENLALVDFTKPRPLPGAAIDPAELFPILDERMDQPGGTLSGGEQQMLAVARALRAHPQLLLLDEPSLGMAPRIVEQLYETLAEVKQTGVAMLIAEQAARRAIDIADYVYVLGAGGRIISQGPARTYDDDDALYSAYLS